MPDLTPAAELRAAAARLRQLAADTSPGPWPLAYDTCCTTEDCPHAPWVSGVGPLTHVESDHGEDAMSAAVHWIAAMHPGVGVALADWLDDAARGCDATVVAARRVWPLDCDESEAFIQEQAPARALAVARALGGAQ